MRRVVFAFLLAIYSASAAQAALLQCSPEEGRLRAFVDGFGKGDALPEGLETFRAFVRPGADEYEFQPDHITRSSLKGGVLRIEARRDLSGGEAAEFEFEGNPPANGGEFAAKILFRSEGRVISGTVRCKLI
jgi:hypothetical protein